jgi:hypothetical protein
VPRLDRAAGSDGVAVSPDVFITIAFCAEVSLVAVAGGLFIRHEWLDRMVGVEADRRERSRLAHLPADYPESAAKPPTMAP